MDMGIFVKFCHHPATFQSFIKGASIQNPDTWLCESVNWFLYDTRYFQTGYSVVKFQGKNVLKILFVNIYFRKVTLSLV